LTIFKYDNNLNFLYYKVFSSGEFTDPDNTTGVDVRDVVCDDAGNIYLIRSTNQITKINGDDGSIIETANIGGAYHSPVMYACISNGEQPYFNSYHSAQ
jgi:hypothetical protein